MRFTLGVLGSALALGWAPLAHAGGQVTPHEDEAFATAAPVFAVELLADDVNARVEVTTEDGVLVGACVPAPASCSLAAPLANGAYFWTLHFQNRFCDGYQGEICELVDRSAGPRRFEVAVPRTEPRALVPGRAIGAARLGMTLADAHALYGEPVRARGATESFTVPGGLLELTFTAGRASVLATTSRYYRSPAGLGVGTAPPRGWKRVGRELVLGKTRLLVVAGRVARVTVLS